jgi:ribosomal protein S18 acetylase RimI-like enzyme
MPDVNVRQALRGDLPVLRDIFRRSSLSNPSDVDALRAHPEVLIFSDQAVKEWRTRVATLSGGQVVGFATTLEMAGALELEDLFVDPEWMRRGIGRELVRDVVASAAEKGIDRIEVTANPDALAVYESVGFSREGKVATRLGPAHRMHLDIHHR